MAGFCTAVARQTIHLFLNGLIERQLALGKSLLVCFVDFSNPFDIINRNILFYRLMKSGWKGCVRDTLRNLYNKANFRVKRHGLYGIRTTRNHHKSYPRCTQDNSYPGQVVRMTSLTWTIIHRLSDYDNSIEYLSIARHFRDDSHHNQCVNFVEGVYHA